MSDRIIQGISVRRIAPGRYQGFVWRSATGRDTEWLFASKECKTGVLARRAAETWMKKHSNAAVAASEKSS